ncbi:MAG: hypothetical protein AAF226_07915 [Verrucomicrobiota bacterium]
MTRLLKFLTLSFLLLAGVAGSVFAVLNEAISLSYDAAVPYVEEGFEVREENWSGEGKSHEPKLIKHQLFRGNSYWFWMATSIPGAISIVDIYDEMGNSVSIETFSKDGMSGASVLPPKTGVYFIRVEVQAEKKGSTIDWGLTYGYR